MDKKSKSYWEKRQKQWINNQNKTDDVVAKKLKIEYKKTAKELEKEIAGYFQRYGMDNVIEFRAMMQDLPKTDRDLLFQNMDAFALKYPEHANLLPVRESIYKLNRLQGLHYSTQVKLLELGAIEQKELEKHLEETYGKRYNEMLEELGIGNAFLSIDNELMKDTLYARWVNGQNFSERIWKNKENLLNHLRSKYRDGLARGDNYAKLTKEVKERFDVSHNDARRLVWTESSFVLNQAHTHAYLNADVEEYEISAVMDRRTSPICRELDGKVFRFDEMEVGTNFPPFHPYCRTTFMGVLEEHAASGIIDANEGKIKFTDKVKGNMTDEQQETLEGILGNAPREVQSLWTKVQDDLVTANSRSKKSYYSRGEGVYFNFAEDSINEKMTRRNGSPVLGKSNHTTFFHEYGHHIDALFGFDDIVKIKYKSTVTKRMVTDERKTWSYKSKELGLSDSLKNEIKETITKFEARNIEDLAGKLTKYADEKYPYGYSGVSDILSGLSDDRANMGWHHSKKYWRDRKKQDGLGKEAFAHMFASHTMQGDADKFMKEVFPKSYKKVIDFIEEAGK